MYSFPKSRHGFTMLPLILFMFVIVGLISAGYLMLGPKVQLGKTVETKAGLEKAVDAIISWSVANGRIPNATDIQNILPQTTDSYGAKLGYLFDVNLADKTKGGVCGRTQTDAKDAANVYYAFVLISGGNDYTINSTPTQTALIITDQILTAQLPTIPSPYNGLSPNDLFRVVTLEELKNRAGCYGSTQGRLKILNNELPNGCEGIKYVATIFADGGISTQNYTWELINKPSWMPSQTPAPGTFARFSSSTVTTGSNQDIAIRLSNSGISVEKAYKFSVNPCP